jgi:hypothetical protein
VCHSVVFVSPSVCVRESVLGRKAGEGVGVGQRMTFDDGQQGESGTEIAVGLRCGQVAIVQLQGSGGADYQVL